MNPITLRPRDGDSVTGLMKLQKAISTFKVGKLLVKIHRDKINKVKIQRLLYL